MGELFLFLQPLFISLCLFEIKTYPIIPVLKVTQIRENPHEKIPEIGEKHPLYKDLVSVNISFLSFFLHVCIFFFFVVGIT